MKYIIIEDGDIYSVTDESAKHIEAASNLAKAIDGDMTDIIDAVREYGKFIGTVFMTVRN
ncbi:hypothetical protein [uncultured Parabacteroides sp.]|mgnify:CR=1 FL=1|uniref:hypothetical protein n=1 Tax=uncultured Parabacteroides sp. TaxID=512312 RepID=UPI00261C40F3|nr:hypothetical protein [uncultured Parabacteroides sp.]